MKHKTSELTGALLDAAVAKAEGLPYELRQFTNESDGSPVMVCTVFSQHYIPSTDWADGGPIIDREKVAVSPSSSKDQWEAGVIKSYGHEGPEAEQWMYGPTPLIAAMRAYVVSKLGDEVEL